MSIADHTRPGAGSERPAGPIIDAQDERPTTRRPTAAEWSELLARDRTATPSLDPRWMELVIGTTAMEDASTLFEFPDGSRVLLPLAGRRWPNGRIAAAGSMPAGWGFGGTLGDETPTSEQLTHVWRHLMRQPALRIRIRPNPLHAEIWSRSVLPPVKSIERRAHVVDLRDGFDAVWAHRASSDARSNVRRAERLGVDVTSGNDDDHLRAYRYLLARSRERWATSHREPVRLARWRAERADPVARIEAMIGCSELCRLWVAWHRGEPAAAIIVALGQNAHYTRGAMDRDLAATTRANDLLQRTAIEHACSIGCDWYHMGESGSSRSLARFKERFGARPYRYDEYLVERLPLHTVERTIKQSVKRTIGYRDA